MCIMTILLCAFIPWHTQVLADSDVRAFRDHSLGDAERREIEVCEHGVAIHPQHKGVVAAPRIGLEKVAEDHDL